jgi:hypothetical protein
MDKQKREDIKKLVKQARDAVFKVYENESDLPKRTILGEALGACDKAMKKLDDPDTGYPKGSLVQSPLGR